AGPRTDLSDGEPTPGKVEPPPVEPVDEVGTGIRGTVVDSAGAPVAGVTVTATMTGGGGINMPGMEDLGFELDGMPGAPGMVRPGGKAHSGVSGADGTFAIGGLDAANRYRLQLRGGTPDFLVTRCAAPALQDGKFVDAGTLRIDRAGTITGVVRDANGAPVAGATVRLGEPMPDGMQVFRGTDGSGARMGITVMRTETNNGDGNGDGSGNPDGSNGNGSDPPPAMMMKMPGVTTTDANGQYTLERVRPGKQMVSARKQGHRDAIVNPVDVQENAETHVDLQLGAALSLLVTVRDPQGFPIEGARVNAAAAGGIGGMLMMDDMPGPRGNRPPTGVLTDATGRALLDKLTSIDVQLRITADGYATLSEQIRLDDTGETRREFTLQPGCRIVGRAVGSDGTPLRNAMLHLQPIGERNGGMFEGPMGGMHPTGEDGRFEFSGLQPGSWKVIANHPEYAQTEAGPYSVSAGGQVDAGDIRLTPVGKVTVKVVDADGKPVAGATVDAGQTGAVMMAFESSDDDDEGSNFVVGDASPTTTNADGMATLERVNPGKVTVRARKSGFAAATAEVMVAPGETASATLILGSGGRLEGTAKRRDGSPWAGAQINLYAQGPSLMPLESARADAQGKFVFEHVAAGEYDLSTDGMRLGGSTTSVTVRDGQTTTTTFVEPAATALHLTVLNHDGSPAAGRPVVLGWMQVGGDGGYSIDWPMKDGYTDPNGQVKFDSIRSGQQIGAQITSEDGARHVFRLDLDGSDSELTRTLRLPPPAALQAGAALAVTVTDTDAQPLPGATVIVTRTTKDDSATFRRQVRTGIDGTARIDNAPPGTYRVEVSAATRALEVEDLDLAAGTATDRSYALSIAGHAALQIVPIGGMPSGAAPPVVVEARLQGGDPSATRTRAGLLGSVVTFDNLRLGSTYEVEVRCDGYATRTLIVQATADVTEPLRVELAR
ncbi:MAG: carboxypeptidase regulatory-like domain-containing protein, partial [Planctomycetota bacterium]